MIDFLPAVVGASCATVAIRRVAIFASFHGNIFFAVRAKNCTGGQLDRHVSISTMCNTRDHSVAPAFVLALCTQKLRASSTSVCCACATHAATQMMWHLAPTFDVNERVVSVPSCAVRVGKAIYAIPLFTLVAVADGNFTETLFAILCR